MQRTEARQQQAVGGWQAAGENEKWKTDNGKPANRSEGPRPTPDRECLEPAIVHGKPGAVRLDMDGRGC
jgi:hypothetical protein